MVKCGLPDLQNLYLWTDNVDDPLQNILWQLLNDPEVSSVYVEWFNMFAQYYSGGLGPAVKTYMEREFIVGVGYGAYNSHVGLTVEKVVAYY